MTKRGKYMNMQVMGRDASIRHSLPETRIFTSKNLHEMINKYRTVIAKPNFGTGGAGVIKVSRINGGKYAVHFGTTNRVITGNTSVLAYLRRFAKAQPYIVQRYVSLAKVNGRPIDVRVMVQRKTGVPWTVTGKIAKVAGPHHIITNVARSRGYVLSARGALTKTFSRKQSEVILKKLDRICLRAARQIGIAYGRRTLGFDMAVDRKGKVWVLEANPKPAIGFFKRLKNKSYYRHILRLAPSKEYHRYFTGKV
ncbi:YheC/YheD family protein [Cohnella caldifontis]|uniref:YheC/YheD family protein n=1 Tax=Cohnella caldifontis TaxID=3027471 RepID=UPI0023ED545D|nr:YheC/YheD family protein [Cohnella sp. YIM B05605]